MTRFLQAVFGPNNTVFVVILNRISSYFLGDHKSLCNRRDVLEKPDFSVAWATRSHFEWFKANQECRCRAYESFIDGETQGLETHSINNSDSFTSKWRQDLIIFILLGLFDGILRRIGVSENVKVPLKESANKIRREYRGDISQVEIDKGLTGDWWWKWASSNIMTLKRSECEDVINEFETRVNCFGYSLKHPNIVRSDLLDEWMIQSSESLSIRISFKVVQTHGGVRGRWRHRP